LIKFVLRTPAWTGTTAHKSKQQPKFSLKARYESKTRFKITNLIKKLKKLDKNPSLDSGLAVNLNVYQNHV